VKYASRTSAHNYLMWAKTEGYIRDFKQIHSQKGLRWVIDVPPTRYNAYNNIEQGQIVLSTREVMAFMEGLWTGAKINPVSRAGS
jgi:hypothetical protein